MSCLRCFYCVVSVSEFSFCVVDREFGLFGLVEQIRGSTRMRYFALAIWMRYFALSIRMRYEFRKTHMDKEN